MRGECFHLGQCQREEAGLGLAWRWGSSSGFRGLCLLLCSGLFCSVLMADAFTLANVIKGEVGGLGWVRGYRRVLQLLKFLGAVSDVLLSPWPMSESGEWG